MHTFNDSIHLLIEIGEDLGKAFDIPKFLLGETFFAAVVVKVYSASCDMPTIKATGMNSTCIYMYIIIILFRGCRMLK